MSSKAKPADANPAPNPDQPAVEVVPIASLIPDAANVRVRDDRARRSLAASLKQFGPARSIVLDGKGVVRAGNGTVEAAQEAGVAEVLVIRPKPGQLVAVRRDDWSATEATGYALADNRLAQLAEWDFEGVAETIRSLQADDFDVSTLGWADHELEPILAAEWSPPEAGEMPGVGDDDGDDDAEGDDDGEGEDEYPHAVQFSAEAWQTVEQAIRHRRGDGQMTDAEALEAICGEYLAAPGA